MNPDRLKAALTLCVCQHCDMYKAPEQLCPQVYRAALDIELRQARVLSRIDGAAKSSARHGDIWADVADVYRAELARRQGVN